MSINEPQPSYKKGSRDSLSRLLADNLMVTQLMDYEKEKGYTLVDVPYEHKDLNAEEKIETRLNRLNLELEKELSGFKSSSPKIQPKKNSLGEKIRRSLFAPPKPRGNSQQYPWKSEQSGKKKGRPSVGCLILMLALLSILVTALTLVLVFTINHSGPPNQNASALNSPSQDLNFDMECSKSLNCFNDGIPSYLDGECKCQCPPTLTGNDCRTLIVKK